MWIPERLPNGRYRLVAPSNPPSRRVLATVSESRLHTMMDAEEARLKKNGTTQPEGSSPVQRTQVVPDHELKGAPLTV